MQAHRCIAPTSTFTPWQVFDDSAEPTKTIAELEEEEKQLRRKQQAEASRRERKANPPEPRPYSVAGPSHIQPKVEHKAPLTEAEKLAALQWKEGAADRTAEGKRRQAEAHPTTPSWSARRPRGLQRRRRRSPTRRRRSLRRPIARCPSSPWPTSPASVIGEFYARGEGVESADGLR